MWASLNLRGACFMQINNKLKFFYVVRLKFTKEINIYTLPIFGYNKIVYHPHTNSCAT